MCTCKHGVHLCAGCMPMWASKCTCACKGHGLVFAGVPACAGCACACACRISTCAHECMGCKVCLCLCAPSNTSRGVCSRSHVPQVGVRVRSCRWVGWIPAEAVPRGAGSTCAQHDLSPAEQAALGFLSKFQEGKRKQSLLPFPSLKSIPPLGSHGGGQHPSQPHSWGAHAPSSDGCGRGWERPQEGQQGRQ